MFDSIYGRLTVSEPTRVVVEAGGLGYEIQVPLSTYEVLPALEEPTRLLLHPVVRETEWRLYGFHTAGERDVFRALLRVNGVGPAMALGLLSGFAPAELCNAVTGGDVRALTRVKGIGRKTAERIVVELRDVVSADLVGEDVATTTAVSGLVDDAVRALTALGLDLTEARRRVEAHAKEGDLTVSELVRAALRG